MNEPAPPTDDLVRRAQTGDLEAWTALVDEFQDVAAGLAAGWSGDWARAEDIAQDAFVTAFLHLHDLDDPRAFPAWFKQVVHSSTTRHLRRDRRASDRSRSECELAADVPVDPVDAVAAADDARRLHLAVEHLPEPERAVIALHYLAGLPYSSVAELLGITVSAAKERAFSARQHLKELLPMTIDALGAARPSRNPNLRETVALFLGIRQRDHDLVRALLDRNPSLVSATESWSKDEAMQLGLQNAERGTPLVRAVQTGDAQLVQLVLDSGARTEQPCGCAGAERALWVAALAGDATITKLLLAASADPNASAFAGATPLIVAAQRGHAEVTATLLDAGADPLLTDDGGRTAADWSTARGSSRVPGGSETLATGIRALDLFAPVRRGSTQWWPAAWELGQFALLTEIVRAIGPSEFWQVGFATGPYDDESGRQWLRQFPVATRLHLTAAGPNAAERRNRFEMSMRAVTGSPAEKIVMILTSPGHHHDVTVARAQLARDPSVLTTVVIEPATDVVVGARATRPEGFDAQVAFDSARAARQLWPAIDAVRTNAGTYPSGRHADLAETARAVIADYARLDPQLERRDPAGFADPTRAARAQALHRYLVQPFELWEHRTGRPGESTPYSELLETVDALLTT